MKICRIKIKNFGKLADRDFDLSEGVQLFYGENESGKSTVHSFLKGKRGETFLDPPEF